LATNLNIPDHDTNEACPGHDFRAEGGEKT
jgi:hypothetical protein